MKDYINSPSCRTCIWNEQCEDEKPCVFYDDGHNEITDLTDKQLEALIEKGRLEFRKEYNNYLNDYYSERLCKDD